MAANWGRRKIQSFGSHFRIESGSPLVGKDGPETVKIYATNDNGEVFLLSHGQGTGLGRIASDKSIEIRAGDKNDPNSIDIRVSAATGDITINADRGRVRVNAKDIMVTANRDIDLKAGRNINLQAGVGRILLKANTAQVKAKRGNLVPESWGKAITKNSFIPDDTIAKIFSPESQSTSLGSAPGGFDGVAGAALKGFNMTLEDLNLSGQTGAIDAIEKAEELVASKLINPLQQASNLLEGKLDDPLGTVLDKVGAGSLKNSIAGGLKALENPIGTAMGVSPLSNIPGSTSISNLGNKILSGTPVGSAMNVIKGTGNKVLTGSIESLTSGAASALGVKPGGNALTGVANVLGTGSVAKGAAATVSNMTSDALASLDGGAFPKIPTIPGEKLSKTLSNNVHLYMENLKQDLVTAAEDPNLKTAITELAQESAEALIKGEETIGVLKEVSKKFKLL